MIPIDNNDLILDFEIERQPSKTYKISDNNINSICDGIEAVKQAIYLILNTERYKYLIYSWNHGIELQDLYGQSTHYIIPELQRRIIEALTQDDRIESVDNFNFDIKKKVVSVNFTVHTIYGDIESGKEVSI